MHRKRILSNLTNLFLLYAINGLGTKYLISREVWVLIESEIIFCEKQIYLVFQKTYSNHHHHNHLLSEMVVPLYVYLESGESIKGNNWFFSRDLYSYLSFTSITQITILPDI